MRSSISLVPFVVAAIASGVLLLESISTSPVRTPQRVMTSLPLFVPRSDIFSCGDDGPRSQPYLPTLSVSLDAKHVVTFNDGSGEERMTTGALLTRLQRLQQSAGTDRRHRFVYVDFASSVRWQHVVETMDKIRGTATDPDHDQIVVTLAMK